MTSLLRDLRYSLRALGKSPGFTAVALATLAVGIGSSTAIFSVVHAALLRPLPFAKSEGILTLWHSNIRKGVERDEVSAADFLDWKERNRVFASMAAAEPYGFDLIGQGEPETIPAWLVTREFFDILGVRPQMGRLFSPGEYAHGGEGVVLLGHELWKARFGADPAVVGRTLSLDGKPLVVVGILPEGFQFPPGRELWAPRPLDDRDRTNARGDVFTVIARLRPGVSVPRAQAEMDGIAAQLARERPRQNEGIGAVVVSLRDHLFGRFRTALLTLLAAVGFLLLIACANVANLLLARGTRRERELAIRAALGASRRRLVMLPLLESGVLALLGGIGGLALASWAVDAFARLAPGDLPRIAQASLDGRVLLFALAISAVTVLFFGLAPALQSSRPNLVGTIGAGSRAAGVRGRRGMLGALVIGELALALVLLTGAGLLIRSFLHLANVDPGFTKERALVLQVFLWDRYSTEPRRAAFVGESLERIAALPGVEAAGAVSSPPFIGFDITAGFTVEGRAPPQPGQEPRAWWSVATPDYFRAMGIRLLRGRSLAPSDGPDAPPVALINESMARRHWPGEDPVGKKIAVQFRGRSVREIVGVVADVRRTGLDSDPRPEIFVPYSQSPFGHVTFVVRTRSEAAGLAAAVKAEIWKPDRTLPIYKLATIERLISDSLADRRLLLALLAGFAAAALGLAGIGIYGVIGYLVGERTAEIGLRMALGAGRGQILRLVLREGAVLTFTGIALGLVASLALTRSLRAFLFGTAPADPVTFAATCVLLAAIALLASYLPARRAMGVDPMISLRSE